MFLASACGRVFGELDRKTYILPCVKFQWKERALVDHSPEHNGNKRRECHYTAVEDRMRRLQLSRPSFQFKQLPWTHSSFLREVIRQSVETCEEKIEG